METYVIIFFPVEWKSLQIAEELNILFLISTSLLMLYFHKDWSIDIIWVIRVLHGLEPCLQNWWADFESNSLLVFSNMFPRHGHSVCYFFTGCVTLAARIIDAC